jgi:hypothetical protein
MAIWNILLPFGYLVAIGYIFTRFGTVRQEKSSNPALGTQIHFFALHAPKRIQLTGARSNILLQKIRPPRAVILVRK